MKPFSTLKRSFVLLLLPVFSLSYGQSYYYHFSQTTGTYTELSNATILTTNLAAPNYNYPLPSGFKLFDKDLNNFVQVGKDGWAINHTADYFFAYDPFYPFSGCVAKSTGSSISATTEVTAGDTIVKLQWKNVNIKNHPATDSLNFQLWLYKKSQTIEFRYGPSYLTNMNDSIQLTLVLTSADYIIDYENHQLTGSGINVQDNFDSVDVHLYSGVVPNGTIFRFTHHATGIASAERVDKVQVFPNPLSNTLHIKLPGSEKYTIHNVSGNLIAEGIINQSGTVDFRSCAAGVYILKLAGKTFRLAKH